MSFDDLHRKPLTMRLHALCMRLFTLHIIWPYNHDKIELYAKIVYDPVQKVIHPSLIARNQKGAQTMLQLSFSATSISH